MAEIDIGVRSPVSTALDLVHRTFERYPYDTSSGHPARCRNSHQIRSDVTRTYLYLNTEQMERS